LEAGVLLSDCAADKTLKSNRCDLTTKSRQATALSRAIQGRKGSKHVTKTRYLWTADDVQYENGDAMTSSPADCLD